MSHGKCNHVTPDSDPKDSDRPIKLVPDILKEKPPLAGLSQRINPVPRLATSRMSLGNVFRNTQVEDEACSQQQQIEQAFTQAVKKQYLIREHHKHTTPSQRAALEKEEIDHSHTKKIQSLIDQAKKRIGMDLKRNDREYKFKKNLSKFKNIDTYFDVSELIKTVAENPDKFDHGQSEMARSTNNLPESPLLSPHRITVDEENSSAEEDNKQKEDELMKEIEKTRAQDKFKAAQQRAEKFKSDMMKAKSLRPRRSRVLKKINLRKLAEEADEFREKMKKQKLQDRVDAEVKKSSGVRDQIRNSNTFQDLKNYLEQNAERAKGMKQEMDEASQKQYWDDTMKNLQDLYEKEIGGKMKLMPEHEIDDNVTEYIQAIQSRLRKDLKEEEDLRITESLENYKTRSDKVISLLKNTTSQIYNLKWGNGNKDGQRIVPSISDLDFKETFSLKEVMDDPKPVLFDYGNQQQALRKSSIETEGNDPMKEVQSLNGQQSPVIIEGMGTKIVKSKNFSLLPIQTNFLHSRQASIESLTSPILTQGNENNTLATLVPPKSPLKSSIRLNTLSPELPTVSKRNNSVKFDHHPEINLVAPLVSPLKVIRSKYGSTDYMNSTARSTNQRTMLVPITESNKKDPLKNPRDKLLFNITAAKFNKAMNNEVEKLKRHSSWGKPKIEGSQTDRSAASSTKKVQQATLSSFAFVPSASERRLVQIQTRLESLDTNTFELRQETKDQIKQINETMNKMGDFYEKKYKEYIVRCEKMPTSLLKPEADVNLNSKKRRAFANNLTKKLLNAVLD